MENLKGTVWVVFNSYAKLILKSCQILSQFCSMSLVDSLTTDQSKIDLLEKAVKIRNRYGTPRLDRKDVVWRKRNYKEIGERSQMDPAAVFWSSMTPGQQAVWNTAAAYSNLTGYQYFVQDYTFRLLNGYSGIGSPSLFHQYKVLEIITGDGYQEWGVYQFHYQSHLEKRLQEGKKNATYWVEIVEGVPVDFVFSFSYFSDMEWASDPEEYYAYVWIEGEKEAGYDVDFYYYPLEMITDWVAFTQSEHTDFISIYGYEIGISSVGAQGTVLVDNFSFVYDSQDWAMDRNCERVDEKFIDNGDGPDYAWWVNYDVGLESVDSLYLGE